MEKYTIHLESRGEHSEQEGEKKFNKQLEPLWWPGTFPKCFTLKVSPGHFIKTTNDELFKFKIKPLLS